VKKKVLTSFFVFMIFAAIMLPYASVFAQTAISSGGSSMTINNKVNAGTSNAIWDGMNIDGSGSVSQVRFYTQSGTLVSTLNNLTLPYSNKNFTRFNANYVEIDLNPNTTFSGAFSYYVTSNIFYITPDFVIGPSDTTSPANVTALTESHSYNSVTLTWVNPTDTDFNGTKIYQDGVFLTTVPKGTSTYTVTGATAGTSYVFKVTSVDNVPNESSGTSITSITASAPPPPDTIAPSVPNGLTAVVGDSQIALNWNVSTDNVSLAGYNVFVDGVKNNASLITTNHYSVIGLTNGTVYAFKVSAVDVAGNESLQSAPISAKPDVSLIVPLVPVNEQVAILDSALSVTWSVYGGSNATGFNVYVDGVKQNSSLISSTSYIISGLANGVTYAVSVSAVNSAGESAHSSFVNGTPSKSALPFISLGYTLSDVATGFSNWFGSIWLILAFSISIPLSFAIGRRIKAIFE
jgi:hypothetical protein